MATKKARRKQAPKKKTGKASANKASANKASANKASAKKASAKKAPAKKASAKKASANKASAKKAPAKKASANKASANKASAKKAPAKKAPAKKAPAKKAPAKKPAKKAGSKSTSARKSKARASSASAPGASGASQRIDRLIADTDDWRGKRLAQIRRLIHEADPDVLEEWKWMGTPVWSNNGMYVLANPHKEKVKIQFFHGAQLRDPKKLFNNGLDGNKWRAIDLRENDTLHEANFKALLKEAMAYNQTHKVAKSKGSNA